MLQALLAVSLLREAIQIKNASIIRHPFSPTRAAVREADIYNFHSRPLVPGAFPDDARQFPASLPRTHPMDIIQYPSAEVSAATRKFWTTSAIRCYYSILASKSGG